MGPTVAKNVVKATMAVSGMLGQVGRSNHRTDEARNSSVKISVYDDFGC
jgi:hypothetical protein